jgi:hypothetical protein
MLERLLCGFGLSTLALLGSSKAFALGEPQHVTSTPAPGSLALASRRSAAPLVVEPTDWPGVQRAVHTFAFDVHAVTGLTPAVLSKVTGERNIVLIGTIGRSSLLDKLVAEGRLDVSDIRNRWEMSVTQILTNPFPGVRSALVIAGSDKRGTIFGVYDLSEQIGVSPWYWWADVPIVHKE